MARRPSTISVASFASSKGVPGSSKSPAPPQALSLALSPSASASKLPRSASASHSTNGLYSSKSQNGITHFDPDDLFTKCTIAEVKAKQVQLRADAEAKQEELRIMVGERYRDLLQASTSIIAISKSAHRVQEALDETRTAIREQEQPPEAKRSAQGSKEDAHLQTLQVLSAHIKLLLDAPEHLWRLIERERYFQAAWLFLLARVIHRALQADEESWINQGINVLDQFPLIQRQWETVSHFRTQIIHKATLSLRVYDRTAEDTCATLLTLHILDSRPLTDTLATYLTQRSRTLSTLLSKIGDVPSSSTPQVNGANASKASRVVKTSLQTALEVIVATITTARSIFYGSPSLAAHVLEYIQSDSHSSPTPTLPKELLLTTQELLSALPSSTYFAILPPAIKSYKPYVDLSSPSSSLPSSILHQKLAAWFAEAQGSLGSATERWIRSVRGVKGVWGVRCAVKTWLSGDGGKDLKESERVALGKAVDGVLRDQIVEIWRGVLGEAEREFTKEVQGMTEGGSSVEDFSALNDLYKLVPVPPPPAPNSPPSAFDKPFQKYREGLRQRLSPSRLGVLEKCAGKMRGDFARIEEDDAGDGTLTAELSEAYQPEAAALCTRVIAVLKAAVDSLTVKSDTAEATPGLIFVARVANDLASPSSNFVQNVGCDETVAHDFREQAQAIFDRAIARWEGHAVSHAIEKYTDAISISTSTKSSQSRPASPSSALTVSLFALSSAIHNLGLSHHPARLGALVPGVLGTFCAAFTSATNPNPWQVQTLHDALFLRRLSRTWEDQTGDCIAAVHTLDKAISKARSLFDADVASGLGEHDPERSAAEHLMRTQLMLGVLLPQVPPPSLAEKDEAKDKMSPLLVYGVPVVDAQFRSAVELAKPSTRFGLLLVETR
ncbi:hypothetical protein BV22DRAFT_1109288 [Leucogyrophana mollusca]|uniref:Uncharacterized protein n=1 Tax=Leucogyrophana mollusca TaxID=85980 RepID=A0ACB8BWT4_9AGAM|nr:hypothetical protein BV22DRAFT_1109288 [Leucogyrophana mollusca]